MIETIEVDIEQCERIPGLHLLQLRRGYKKDLNHPNNAMSNYELGWCIDTKELIIFYEDEHILVDISNPKFIDYIEKTKDINKENFCVVKPARGKKEMLYKYRPVDGTMYWCNDTKEFFIGQDTAWYKIQIDGYTPNIFSYSLKFSDLGRIYFLCTFFEVHDENTK